MLTDSRQKEDLVRRQTGAETTEIRENHVKTKTTPLLQKKEGSSPGGPWPFKKKDTVSTGNSAIHEKAQEITTQDIQENKNTIQEEKINRKRMSEKLLNKVL